VARVAGESVLLVDDRDFAFSTLVAALQHHGFEVHVAPNGRAALNVAEREPIDAMVLEVDLVDIDGFEVCRRLRRTGDTTPLVFLTERSGAADRVHGISCGADDYIAKPVDVDELVARLRVVLRRAQPTASRAALAVADLEMDDAAHVVTRGGVPVTLSPTEYRLLRHLLANAGRVVSREELLAEVWGRRGGVGTNAVDTYIGYLRRKVDHVAPKLLHTVRGFGYALRASG
jgi:two-component system OmpR family response regulator